MKSSARSYLLTVLLYVSVINEISLPAVSCQDEEEGYQCMPRKTFFNLLRLPEVTSNVAAYSRKYRNGIASLKGFITENNLSPDICLPADLYLDLFGDPAIRGRLTAIGRAQKMFGDPTTRSYLPIDRIDDRRDELEELEELESESSLLGSSEDDGKFNSEKRSIATLAKNGDLPISLQLDKVDEENEEEEEKRSLATLVHDVRSSKLNRDELEALIRLTELEKRNIASLARDYGLPNGKRNVAALARDFALPQTNSGKRNIASLARDFSLPSSGKRNIASLARDYALPSSGKRNIAALARDYALPYGKRYLDIFSRGIISRYRQPYDDNDVKRNIASLVRNGDLPINYKRNLASLARDWTLPKQYRYGRSLTSFENKDNENNRSKKSVKKIESKISNDKVDDDSINNDEKKLEELASVDSANNKNDKKEEKIDDKFIDKNNNDQIKRSKRQIEFSDEYPLPVMQNNNVLDYEEMIEALTGEYPNTEKRFMAAGEPMMEDMQEMQENEEPIFSPPASKRHIGALARLGWLPSFRTSRFSRSPRYLVNRENSADGTSANYPTDSASRTLGFLGRTTRYSRSQNSGDCRHGFKRFLVLPAVDKLLLHRLYTTPKTA